MSNYPPGVTGNEPQITGEWPCVECGGYAAERNEDGGVDRCPHCKGTGIEPEEFDLEYVHALADEGVDPLDSRAVSVLSFVRCCMWDREKADDRAILKAAAKLKAQR